MAGTAQDGTIASTDAHQDFGWALGTLLRAYLKMTSDAVGDLPGGTRGYQVMMTVRGQSCQNQAAIAENVGLDRTVMTYLIDDLESRGLVVRTPDPNDRRSRRVTLTDVGRETLETVTDRIREAEQRMLGDLAPDEAEQLRSVVGRAARAAEASGTDAEGICTTVDDVAAGRV